MSAASKSLRTSYLVPKQSNARVLASDSILRYSSRGDTLGVAASNDLGLELQDDAAELLDVTTIYNDFEPVLQIPYLPSGTPGKYVVYSKNQNGALLGAGTNTNRLRIDNTGATSWSITGNPTSQHPWLELFTPFAVANVQQGMHFPIKAACTLSFVMEMKRATSPFLFPSREVAVAAFVIPTAEIATFNLAMNDGANLEQFPFEDSITCRTLAIQRFRQNNDDRNWQIRLSGVATCAANESIVLCATNPLPSTLSIGHKITLTLLNLTK